MQSKKQALLMKSISNFWLTIPYLWHGLRAYIHKDAEENYEITVEQFHSLRRISFGCNSVSKLANDKNISRSAVSRAVDGLVHKELVVREQDLEDRRHTRLILTEKGQIMLDELSNRVNHWMFGKLDVLTEDELEIVIQAFGILGKAFEKKERFWE
ncbi:MAG: MarR family transcriptional regulator [Anaerolineaceae bacterium]|nr:MarR family transcriptional regulator [Anaerolineaceae bacterium]